MIFQTLISAANLEKNLDNPSWIVIDCRYSLMDSEQGRREYLHSHIPGSVYLHLDKDLSAEPVPGITGRHPLPPVEDATRVFSNCGIGPGIQVVAYDGVGGALAAVRLWWMLRWLGHNAVAILDGGWQSWINEDYPIRSDFESRPFKVFIPQPNPEMLVGADVVDRIRVDSKFHLCDARIEERYLGENEIIDPLAGHVPGAINLPYTDILTVEVFFRPAKELREYYQEKLGDIPAENTIFYCGSGVTAIMHILALEHIGWNGSLLYLGSWSEWIADPVRPIA